MNQVKILLANDLEITKAKIILEALGSGYTILHWKWESWVLFWALISCMVLGKQEYLLNLFSILKCDSVDRT